MQIQCFHCRTTMMVAPQGGQFGCPVCHAVNVVAAPLQFSYAPHAGHSPAYQAAPRPKKDNRIGYVLAGSVGSSILAFLFGWPGIVLGVGVLAWGIAGALGKVKGPMNVVFPESTNKAGLAAVSIALGCTVATCGSFGVTTQAQQADREAAEAEANREREAAQQAERERARAAEAAAIAAREAELRQNAEQAAQTFVTGLDAVQSLVDAGQWREASSKMQTVTSAAADYRKLDPIPEGIAAAAPRSDALQKTILDVVVLLEAADVLSENSAAAATLTKGNKDGRAWKAAKDKWEAALESIDVLEKARVDLQVHVPKDLSGKRAAIEKSLRQAEPIVSALEAEEAAIAARQALCGDSGCIEVSAANLLADYEANEAGAQSRWGGKRVAVSGIVDSIHLDLFDDPVVNIRGNQRFSFQSVMCEPANAQDANRLGKGQRIVAIGTIGNEIIGSVTLEDCTF